MEVLKEILKFLVEALKIISPYIGVFVGAFLGYFLNNRFDKIKRKRSAKLELIQDVNIFFGIYKDHFTAHNYLSILHNLLKHTYHKSLPNPASLDMEKYLNDAEMMLLKIKKR